MPITDLLTNTETFLGNNLLFSGVGGVDSGPKRDFVIEVGVRCYPGGAIRMSDNEAVDRYTFERLDKYNTNLQRMKVYYCPYNGGEIHMIVLGSSADLMITPTMDGCSFGVGSATSEKYRLVGHVNVTRQPASTSGENPSAVAISEQDEMLRLAMPGGSILSGTDYRAFGTAESGTTIGIRNRASGDWRFYVQNWNRPTGTTQYYLRNPPFRHFA